LGYPTANIAVDADLDAVNGVYAARVRVEGKEYGAMANLGVKPTFSGGKGARVLELHLFDFEGDLYGRELAIELGEFIRPEQRFPIPEILRAQIAEDEETIKTLLNHG
jgi:riboflavin kinase/FMN adenylyltransferase